MKLKKAKNAHGILEQLYHILDELKDYDGEILIKFIRTGDYETTEKIFKDDVIEIDTYYLIKKSEIGVYTIIDVAEFDYIEVLTLGDVGL